MCSFIVTNRKPKNLEAANHLNARRGPDATTIKESEGWTVVHNLLSITGARTEQPFVSQDGSRVCVFNGEIYNWRTIDAAASSDGHTLLPLYEELGPAFTKRLDGEFAIALLDHVKKLLILSTDAFATKPLWFAIEGEDVGVASYESALTGLGFKSPTKLSANTTLCIDLTTKQETSRHAVFDFDPAHQKKDTVDDFLKAFSESIRKRAFDTREKVFIGLSSGYDSGAIASELVTQHIPFHAYSIRGQEDQRVLEARHALLPKGTGEIFEAGYRDYQRARHELKDVCEPFVETLHKRRFASRNILEDAGAVGLGIICKRARAENYKIYLSGQGADEILSDYRMHGHGLTGHSSIDGKFPDDLAAQFPWHNFYDGAQKFYIAKEEHVAGAFGIEARYPFLDRTLVQEFLWLTPELKNKAYKYPLAALFEKRNYPYVPNVKVGFIPRKKTFTDYIARLVDEFTN